MATAHEPLEHQTGTGTGAGLGIVCRQPSHGMAALGLAVALLYQRRPFSDYRFGALVSVLRGQILRGHYLLAFRGDRAFGYSGWAECSREIAQRWLREGYSPTHEECKQGDCAIIISVVSDDVSVTRALIREMRQRFPNRPVYFKREYGHRAGGKVFVFNRLESGRD